MTLAWTSNSGAGTSFKVYQGLSAGNEGATPVKTGVSGTTTVITGLSNGTGYFFKVTAASANGESARSNEASATPAAASLPAAPANLTASAGAGAGAGSVTLHWTAVSGAASYNIYKSTSSHGEAPPVALNVAGGNSTSGTVTGLTAGTNYYFVVQAINAAGHSPSSNEASAKPN